MREPGELRSIIEAALARRNYGDEKDRAKFVLTFADGTATKVIDSQAEGSRYNEHVVTLSSKDSITVPLSVAVTDGTALKFTAPKVELEFGNSASQNSIEWADETTPHFSPGALTGGRLDFTVTAKGACQVKNREDGCADFVLVKILDAGQDKPVAKKRFYLRIKEAP